MAVGLTSSNQHLSLCNKSKESKQAMDNIQVFIYGTLLPGERNAHLAGAYADTAIDGSIAGSLVDSGLYPAAIPAAAACRPVREGAHTAHTAHSGSAERISIIRGLWISVDRAGLAALDALEEFYGVEEQNDYERIWVRDAKRPHLSGWVYVWSTKRGCPSIAGDSWPAYRKRRDGADSNGQ
jgi:gamma-glutamylcyclotransferase (GGCT)/AIG2-like uncharacterized protein YtfP